MKIKLPEKRFFTVSELATRWECAESDIEHLADTKELIAGDKLAAMSGKRITRFIAAEKNPFEFMPETELNPPAGVEKVEWDSGTTLWIGFFHRDEKDVYSIFAFDSTTLDGEITDRDILSEVMDAFPASKITVFLLEDVLAFESKYAVEEREEPEAAAKEGIRIRESPAQRKNRIVSYVDIAYSAGKTKTKAFEELAKTERCTAENIKRIYKSAKK